MGLRASQNGDLFQDTSLKHEGGHDVLVDNFLNAQCMSFLCPSREELNGRTNAFL